MIMTQHALQRWAERFGHLLPEEEWQRSRRVSKKRKRHILETCVNHRAQMTGGSKGYYYRLSPRNVVFVVAEPDVVVTVFRYRDRVGGRT